MAYAGGRGSSGGYGGCSTGSSRGSSSYGLGASYGGRSGYGGRGGSYGRHGSSKARYGNQSIPYNLPVGPTQNLSDFTSMMKSMKEQSDTISYMDRKRKEKEEEQLKPKPEYPTQSTSPSVIVVQGNPQNSSLYLNPSPSAPSSNLPQSLFQPIAPTAPNLTPSFSYSGFGCKNSRCV